MRMILMKYRAILIMVLLFSALHSLQSQGDLEVDKPILTSVTADTSDMSVDIYWNPSSTPNILRYVIYYLEGNLSNPIGFPIDTVPGNTFHYKHDTDPGSPLYYTVTAETVSGEISPLSGDYHRSVAVDVSYDSCNAEMNLEWTKYVGWKNHASGYRVLCNDGNGTYTEIALLDTSKLSYTHSGIQENQNYKYLVKAFDNRGRTSLSNIKSYFTFMPAPPEFINLDYVSVIDDQNLEISFSADLDSEINDFRLMRAIANPVNFDDLTTIRDVNQPHYQLNDQIATQGTKAYYRIEALNSCLNPVKKSTTASNILLSGEMHETIASLNWQPYEGYAGGVEGYEIYRMNPYGELELVTTIPPGSASYSEDLTKIGQDRMKGEISYQVIAVEGDGNPHSTKGRSSSNILTINVETQLFVPNAFAPNSDIEINKKFGPVMDFTPASYRMLIYDRTGKMLFQTSDPYDGWDGTLDGSTPARQGVYIYYIEYKSYSGSRQVLSGNLSLVNP